ncbi:MAG: hypothetical protein AAGI38_12255 [Bacteroidota bacterium]
MNWDILTLQRGTSRVEDYEVICPLINGISLPEILATIEYPYAVLERQPSLAGMYEGIPPWYLLPPKLHLWGTAEPEYSYGKGKVSLLEYGLSGVPGDWTFIASIHVGEERIIWNDFEQVKRNGKGTGNHWDYGSLGHFTFERSAYEKEIYRIAGE